MNLINGALAMTRKQKGISSNQQNTRKIFLIRIVITIIIRTILKLNVKQMA